MATLYTIPFWADCYVDIPEDENQWTEQTEAYLLVRHAAYGLSLKGQGPTRNQKTVRVLMPRVNLFSVPALESLMDKVRKGESQ